MSEVPQVLQDIAEYEATMWEIQRMQTALASRSPLDVAIDQTTGHEAHLEKVANELMERATELRTRLETD